MIPIVPEPFRCPYTEACRAQALVEFAAMPEMVAVFASRPQCGERSPTNAVRCADRQGLVVMRLPAGRIEL